MSLLERIDAAIAHGVAVGKITSQSDWCIKAEGVTDRYLSNFRIRARQSASATIGADILQALAKVIEVNWVWLASGEGAMFADGATPTSWHASKPDATRSEPAPGGSDYAKQVMSEALGLDLPPAAREAVLAFCEGTVDQAAHDAALIVLNAKYSGGEKLTAREWLEMLNTRAAQRRKGFGSLGLGARELEDENR